MAFFIAKFTGVDASASPAPVGNLSGDLRAGDARVNVIADSGVAPGDYAANFEAVVITDGEFVQTSGDLSGGTFLAIFQFGSER